MKKLIKTYTIVWTIAFVLFQVICFATPNEVAGYHKINGTFWAAWAFVTLAFVGQLLCARRAFQTDKLQKLFYNFPILTISYTGLIIMLIAASITFAIPDLPCWVAIVVCAAVLAFTAIAVVKADTASEIVEQQDAKLLEITQAMKSMQGKAALCAQRCEDAVLKRKLAGMAEEFRYADPVSSSATAATERELENLLDDLAAACRTGENETIERLSDTISSLLKERNLLCRSGK